MKRYHINTLYALFLTESQRTISMHRHMIAIARLTVDIKDKFWRLTE